MEKVTLIETKTKPFEQKAIHRPFVLEQVVGMHYSLLPLDQMLYLYQSGIVVYLQMQVGFKQVKTRPFESISHTQHGRIFTA
jgi:hypothetical protein